jgi:uncharacterized membrane protein (UPF0182 family)
VGLAITAAVVAICLILLGVMGDFLVDWLWFSAIGYLGVFWTTIFAEAAVFFAVFLVGRFHGSNHMPTKIGPSGCSCEMPVNEEAMTQPI